MPFTLAHAAAAFPLHRLSRGSLVFPLLVIGCFVPDLPHFLPEPFAHVNAHRFPEMVAFGVPCGWGIHLIWRRVLLEPGIALLPERYAVLFFAPASIRTGAVRWWPGTLSLLAGSLSHVVWDAFTHRRGLVVYAWPTLAQPLVHVAGHALPPYFLFQHVSTALGMLCLAMCVRSRAHKTPRDPLAGAGMPQLRVATRIALIAALLLATAVAVWWTFARDHAPPFCVYNFVCGTVSAACIVAVAYALAWHACMRSGLVLRRRDERSII